MAVIDNRTTANGDSLLISLRTPYKGVVEVSDFTIDTTGETPSVYYRKEFRYSTDGVLYNDWRELTAENLRKLLLNSANNFYPQYKLTQVGDGELAFNSIALEVTSIEGIVENVPLCSTSDGNAGGAGGCCGGGGLVYECCGADGIFNPYATGNAPTIYNQMSQLVANMFGFCITYFKTSADQRSKDVVLHEYNLENVIAQNTVKIVVPDNNLPTREINFNAMMLDFQTVFEVHIVKSMFWEAFGMGSKPDVHDYLYFEQYMNRMYEVNAVSETDDYMYTGAYWRVSLTPYQQRAAVRFDTEELDLATHTLIFDNDKFNVEAKAEEKDVRKPEQLNTFGTGSKDRVRRLLDKELIIQPETIYNGYTVISKHHYKLGSIRAGETAVAYRYDGGMNSDEERMVSLWFRRGSIGGRQLGDKHGIKSVGKNSEGYAVLTLNDEAPITDIREGTVVFMRLRGYDDTQIVSGVDTETNEIAINSKYIRGVDYGADEVIGTVQWRSSATLFSQDDSLDILATAKGVAVRVNGNSYSFPIYPNNTNDTIKPNCWYALCLALKPADNKVALWVYELGSGENERNKMDSKLKNIYYKCLDGYGLAFGEGVWRLVGSPETDVTNIRIWNSIAQEELHNLLLSQYTVRDAHLCELCDNAQPELLLDKVTNPR